jgi:hypothetical protein
MNILPNNPFYRQYQQYNTQFPALECVGFMLYDTVLYTSAASVTLNFFTAGPRASLDLTNMEIPSQLPAPKAFLIRAFRFYVKQQPRSTARAASGSVQPGAMDNMAQLLNTGVLTLIIGAKPYAQFPLWMIPSGGGAYPYIGVDGNAVDPGQVVDYAQSGIPSPDNAFVLSQPLFIAPQINFALTLTWPAAITLSGGNTNLCVGMDGDLLRPIQ